MNKMFNHTDIIFRDIPGIRQRFDYGARTDGQPDYIGYADIEATDASVKWVIFKYSYNGDGSISMIESRRGSWDGRVALFP